MNPNYKPLQQRADRLHHTLSGWIDDKGHPAGAGLVKESMMIREEIESNKPPRSVEDRIKRVQQLLKQESPAISVDHAKTLEDDYEDLRREIRALPNY